jgi:regulatory protein
LVAKGAQGERIGVYLDERFAFDLAALIVEAVDLHQGDALTEELEASLLERDLPYRAQNLAMGVLSHRELCRGEVATRLRRAGFADGVVADTLSWLQERGYVDDRRFAAAYAAERLRAGWGKQRIVGELLRKGVEREVVSGEALGELIDGQGTAEQAESLLALVKRRFGSQMAVDPEGAKRRIAAFLARRGHDWDAIGRITRLLSEESSPAGDEPLRD